MTKSGIGTTGTKSNTLSPSLSSSAGGGLNNNTNQPPSTTTITTTTAQAEIPIWVADKKKWVTGISKKTTVNDLIYAILKQCQIIPPPFHSNESTAVPSYDMISSQYVLVENHQPQSDSQPSQRILNGDSKVYKYLSKWSQTPTVVNNKTQTTANNSGILLKILQREPINVENSSNSETTPPSTNEAPAQPQSANSKSSTSTSTPNIHTTTSSSSTNQSGGLTKLLKKFGASSSTSSSSSSSKTNPPPCVVSFSASSDSNACSVSLH